MDDLYSVVERNKGSYVIVDEFSDRQKAEDCVKKGTDRRVQTMQVPSKSAKGATGPKGPTGPTGVTGK